MTGRICQSATIFLGEKSADSKLIMDFLGVFQIEDAYAREIEMNSYSGLPRNKHS